MRLSFTDLLVWLLWVAATVVAAGSCSDVEQELSSYWDGYDFRSVEAFYQIDEAEKTFEGYVRLLEKVPADVAETHMYEFLDSAALNQVAYILWAGWFEAYLHVVESPYRNDVLFRSWLDKVISDNLLDDFMMARLVKIKEVSGLNAVGMTPSDLSLRDADGNGFRISDLKGERTLLLFLDGGCRSCMEYLTEIYREYRRQDVRLVAVLLNASEDILTRVLDSLPEDVASRWTLSWCPGREIEDGKGYDLTMIPSRILVSPDGLIEKSYH